MRKKKKQEKVEPKVHPVTMKELAEERRVEVACQKPIKIGWAIYGAAAILYLLNGLFTQIAVTMIPQEEPIANQLIDYRYSAEYNDFIAETEKDAIDKLTKGEITLDEYNYLIETLSSDEKFEEFLRSIENDKEVQSVIENYDKYAEQIQELGKVYAGLSITALSSTLVATLILAKYRFREMDVEEKRKKRAKELGIDLEKYEQ